MSTLRALRHSRLLSQRELARRAGVSPSTVLTTETGRRRPALTTIRRLSEALQVPPMDVSEFRDALVNEAEEETR